MEFSNEEKKSYEALLQLGCSKEEAEETIIADRAINKGEKLFELSEEQEKNSKIARRADRKKNTTYSKRERKEDTEKRELISIIEKTLQSADSVTVTNPERQIDFSYKERKFRLVLSAPRS